MADVKDLSERAAVARAAKAKAMLSDQEFTGAFDAVRAQILDRIEECPIRDREGVHELKLMLKLLGDVRANIEHVVNTGRVIEYRLSLLERAKKGIEHAFKR